MVPLPEVPIVQLSGETISSLCPLLGDVSRTAVGHRCDAVSAKLHLTVIVFG